VSQRQASGLFKLTAWRRVRVLLANLYRGVRRHGRRGRALLDGLRGGPGSTHDDGRRADARDQFWAEFREGQREAAARGAQRER